MSAALSGDITSGVHSLMTANQLIGFAPATVIRTFASSCASCVTPAEQSLTK